MLPSFERLIGFRYLRSRRKSGFISVISVFSFLGIALGVGTLIVVMAVMQGFKTELLNRILGINAHLTISQPQQLITDYETLAAEIGAIEGVQSSIPVIHGQALATANGAHTGAQIRGMSAQSLAQKPMVAEHLIGSSLDDYHGSNIIIGARMAETLGLYVGDTLKLISPKMTNTIMGAIPRMKDYRVVGLFNVGMYEYDSGTIFMPLEAAQTYFKTPHAVHAIEVMAQDINQVEKIGQMLAQQLGVGYQMMDWQQANFQFFNSITVQRNVLFLILSLIILVAAFNIVSGMFMLVNAKGKEIAILRTMGAKKGSILRIFLLAGGVIGVLGTLTGLALGLGFAANIDTIRLWLESISGGELFAAEIYFLSALPAEVRVHDVIGVVGMSLALSLLATLYPAWRAAKMDPVEGLRYE